MISKSRESGGQILMIEKVFANIDSGYKKKLLTNFI
jgi:hypothetical protein